jgi:hypothetical protein
LNTFIITGTKTDFNYLNQQQKDLVFKMSSQSEDYIAEFKEDFNLFTKEYFLNNKIEDLEFALKFDESKKTKQKN